MAKYGELTDLCLKGNYKNCLAFKFMRKKGNSFIKKETKKLQNWVYKDEHKGHCLTSH